MSTMMRTIRFGTLLLGIIVYSVMVISVIMGFGGINLPLGPKYVILTGLIYLVFRLMLDLVDMFIE